MPTVDNRGVFILRYTLTSLLIGERKGCQHLNLFLQKSTEANKIEELLEANVSYMDAAAKKQHILNGGCVTQACNPAAHQSPVQNTTKDDLWDIKCHHFIVSY